MLHVLLAFLFVYSAHANFWPNSIDVGLIANDYRKLFYKLAVDQALSALRNASIVPENFQFNLRFIRGCDDKTSLRAALHLWDVNHTAVIIGPSCEQGISVVALLASLRNRPIIGYKAMSNDLSNREKYSTLSSVAYTMNYIAQAVRAVFVHYRWYKAALLRTHPTNCTVPFSGIPSAFKSHNILITNDVMINISNEYDSIIIIVCAPYSPRDALPVLKYANMTGMLTEDYVYVVPWTTRYSQTEWIPWRDPNITKADSARYQALYRNVLVVSTSGEMSRRFRRFTKLMNKTIDFYSNDSFSEDDALSLAPFHDAVYLYGAALNASISHYSYTFDDEDDDLSDGLMVYNSSIGIQFEGITGPVTLDSNGERATEYTVSRLADDGDGSMDKILNIGVNKTNYQSTDLQVYRGKKHPTNWSWTSTPRFYPPPCEPPCGFYGELCLTPPASSSSTTSLATGLTICMLIFGSAIVIIFIYYKSERNQYVLPDFIHINFHEYKHKSSLLLRKRAFEKDLQQFSWKLDLQKLCYNLSSPGSIHSINSQTLSRSLIGTIRTKADSEKQSFNDNENFFGSYKTDTVVITVWPREAAINFNRDHLLLLKLLKEMVHENINRFIGLSIEAEKSVLSAWNYCAKQSLKDVLDNADIRLDITFQVSMIRDIISGLDYLHSSLIGFHGRLFTNKCLVDGRWIVKLSGFRVKEMVDQCMHRKSVVLDFEDAENNGYFLCKAPELLRTGIVENMKAVDIYQFGMVVYQILYREEPFNEFNMKTSDIVNLLRAGGPLSPRPVLKSVKNCPTNLLTMLHGCWQENPTCRPTVSVLKKEIFTSTSSFGKNLMDHVMAMLEKYASNLEKIVEDRTSQLIEERKRADQLLYQMLPKTVADALKSGQSVQPESFDCATVYFSDIVGFTTICGKSNPLEVVTMLNVLYSQFDSIIAEFAAYKVETIGDAYLVVSGLPVRNGLKHVTDIADMSLKIVQTLNNYTIPHLPSHKLMVRIGIHSGPVAGGVVGLTMPRFCLFGDTVNLASRMETNGQPGKIHISENNKCLLELHPGYVIAERGQIELKGKGLCTTFWLVEKTTNYLLNKK